MKKIIILIIILVLISGCTKTYDECDINKDGKIDPIENKICDSPETVECLKDCLDNSKNPKLCLEECGIEHFSILNQDLIIEPSYDSPFGAHPALISNANYIDRGYEDSVNIGIKWTREGRYIYWMLVQEDLNKKEFDFSDYDLQWGIVPSGMQILGNIAPTPAVILKPGSTAGTAEDRAKAKEYVIEGTYLPIDEEDYIDFVKAAIERYDGDGIDDAPNLKTPIKYWQVGNEPPNRIDNFAELQKMTYDAIKDVCSDCKVLIGGVPGMPPIYIESFDREFLPILEELSKSGKAFDILDFHWYGNATGDYKRSKEAYDHINEKVNELGIDVEEYWITEMGSYSGDPVPKIIPVDIYNYQSEKQQAADYVKKYVYPLSFGVKKIFIAWNLFEGFKVDDGYFDHTGLIYDGRFDHDEGLGVKKLAYYSYKKMTETLEGSDWDNIETIQESDDIYIYKLIKDERPIWVVWNDGEEKTITLNIGDITKVKITEAVPKFETGKEVTNYNTAFNTETKNVQDGSINLNLGEVPVYIEILE
jgi:hypothetical protein